MPKTKTMPDNRYLLLGRRTWYVRVAVPPSLVKAAGKAHIVQSLQTRDAAEARTRRWAVIAKIKADLEELRGAAAWTR